jgi:hypothetical protein
MIGEIPISDACHYMDAHDIETDGSVTANIGWYVVSEKCHHFWELP